MNIQQELKEIISNNKTKDEIITDIEVDINKLEKKAYLFKVMSVADKLEDLVSTDFVKNHELKFLQIYSIHSRYGNLSINVLDKNLNQAKTTSNPFERNKLIKNLNQLIDIFNNVELDWTNLSPRGSASNIIELKLGIGKKFLELLLSPELISTYDYNLMQLNMPQNNTAVEKKIKL